MTTRPTRGERADETRAALVAAGRHLFGRDGYAVTSVQAIVDAGSVTKGAFYHHFATKEDLFLRVFEDVHREIGRRAFVVHLDDEGRQPDDPGRPAIRDLSAEGNAEVWAHLLRACRAYLEMHTDPAVQRIVLLDGPAVLAWEQRQRARDEHSIVLLRADLRRAQARRLVRPLPLRPLATMLAGALDEACTAITNADDPDVALKEAMSVVEAFLSSLTED